MFDILHKWLTNKLGFNKCIELNFSNVGEIFKNGVMFAHLLQKYQVIPDCYIHLLIKNNIYTACLSNIKNINLWLNYLDINLENSTVHEIAHGQSIAVTKLLYQLYFKLEILKQYQILNNINIRGNKQLNMVNVSKNTNYPNILNLNKKNKQKEKEVIVNYETFNVLNLFCSSEGIQYTVIDELKLTRRFNTNKNNPLDFIQHNMNYCYDLLIKNLNNEFFKNETTEKSNEICKNKLFNIINTKEGDIIIDKLKGNNINQIDNLNLKIKNYKYNLVDTQLDNKYTSQNITKGSDNLLCMSQENLNNEISVNSNLEMEESTLIQSLDEKENKQFMKRNILNEYLQQTGLWSSEYLNVNSYDSKQSILSLIVREVLNFEHGKSQIKCLEIKKRNVAGVIDEIKNTKVLQLIKDNLENKGILNFTADDALHACLDAYKEEMKISINNGKLYEVLEEYEYESDIEKETSNQTLEDSLDTNKSGKYFNKYVILRTKHNCL